MVPHCRRRFSLHFVFVTASRDMHHFPPCRVNNSFLLCGTFRANLFSHRESSVQCLLTRSGNVRDDLAASEMQLSKAYQRSRSDPSALSSVSCHDLRIVAISEKEDKLTNIKNIITLSKKKKESGIKIKTVRKEQLLLMIIVMLSQL